MSKNVLYGRYEIGEALADARTRFDQQMLMFGECLSDGIGHGGLLRTRLVILQGSGNDGFPAIVCGDGHDTAPSLMVPSRRMKSTTKRIMITDVTSTMTVARTVTSVAPDMMPR